MHNYHNECATVEADPLIDQMADELIAVVRAAQFLSDNSVGTMQLSLEQYLKRGGNEAANRAIGIVKSAINKALIAKGV